MARSSRREQVRRYLRRREREGLTYAELAEATGESVHTLSWWAWRLRKEEAEAGVDEPELLELAVVDDTDDAETGVEIVLSNGRRLAVRPGFDDETLRRVVEALERSC